MPIAYWNPAHRYYQSTTRLCNLKQTHHMLTASNNLRTYPFRTYPRFVAHGADKGVSQAACQMFVFKPQAMMVMTIDYHHHHHLASLSTLLFLADVPIVHINPVPTATRTSHGTVYSLFIEQKTKWLKTIIYEHISLLSHLLPYGQQPSVGMSQITANRCACFSLLTLFISTNP